MPVVAQLAGGSLPLTGSFRACARPEAGDVCGHPVQSLPLCTEKVSGSVRLGLWHRQKRLCTKLAPVTPGQGAHLAAPRRWPAHPQVVPLPVGGRRAHPAGAPGEGRRAAARPACQAGASPGRRSVDEAGHRGAAAAGESSGS